MYSCTKANGNAIGVAEICHKTQSIGQILFYLVSVSSWKRPKTLKRRCTHRFIWRKCFGQIVLKHAEWYNNDLPRITKPSIWIWCCPIALTINQFVQAHLTCLLCDPLLIRSFSTAHFSYSQKPLPLWTTVFSKRLKGTFNWVQFTK